MMTISQIKEAFRYTLFISLWRLMLPVQIYLYCVLIENISFALRKVESSWKSRFKSNYPLCHYEDAGSKRFPTLLDLLVIRLKNGVPQYLSLKFWSTCSTLCKIFMCLPKRLLNVNKELFFHKFNLCYVLEHSITRYAQSSCAFPSGSCRWTPSRTRCTAAWGRRAWRACGRRCASFCWTWEVLGWRLIY